jgi:hypothetical protein
MTFEPIVIDGRDIKLRYNAGSILTIIKNAGKRIGPAGLAFISEKSGVKFSPSDNIPIEMVMGWMDIDFDTLLWVWGLGLAWKDSGAKPEEAAALYDGFMTEGEPDDGERLKGFKTMAFDALNAARGIDSKKLREASRIAQEKAIAENEKARAREFAIRQKARAEYEAEAGTGKEQPGSASET